MLREFFAQWKQKVRVDGYHFFILFLFCLWGYLYRGFFLEQLELVNDALPYYGHIKYFVNNLASGVYPLWDPVRNCGVPNEFFLRRLGDFNPFYFLIIACQKIGLSYYQAYFAFLAGYFFVGMIGFYQLARCFFSKRIYAVFALMLILFSSLGTRLFASYIILIFVPMIWFFFFFLSFSKSPRAYKFTGMIFSLMLILTTYIPFYFLTALISFLLLFFVIYPDKLKTIFVRYFQFIRVKKLCVFLSLIALGFSLYPGVMLYKEGAKRQFVLPVRNSNSPTNNVLGVDEKRTEPGIFAHLKVDKLFSHLDEVELKVFYVPFFVYILFALGAGVRLNRKILLLITWIFSLFLIGSPEASEVNSFLFEHIFYFKYFRNLRFFLWVAILPAVVLLAIEYLKNLLEIDFAQRKNRIFFLVFNSVIHLGIFAFLLSQPKIIFSTYVTLLMSFLFFTFYAFRPATSRKGVLGFLLLIIFIHPLEVSFYLFKNSVHVTERYKNPETTSLQYVKPFQTFEFTRDKNYSKAKKVLGALERELAPPVYIATVNYEHLRTHIAGVLFKDYLQNRFIVYDSVVKSEGLKEDTGIFHRNIQTDKNQAIVFPELEEKGLSAAASRELPPLRISGENQGIDVLTYDVNSLRIRTHFKEAKFLVYNDNFYPGWEAYRNGKSCTLYRANIAFKGVFLPSGENEIFFRFGSAKEYWIKYGLLLVFSGVLVFIFILWLREPASEGCVS